MPLTHYRKYARTYSKLTYAELRTYIRITQKKLPRISYDDVVWILILREQGEFNKTPAAQISLFCPYGRNRALWRKRQEQLQ